jgi:hypothetical protein
MKLKAMLIILGCIFIFNVGTATALRCGNTFIKEGVKSVEVLDACGEPKLKEVIKSGGQSGTITERWTYGPHKGNYYFLYFKAGVLERVDSKKK